MSLSVLFVRHGTTRWNQEGRIQGHTDVELCAEGRRALTGARVPEPWSQGHCFSSPLTRARQTARLLGFVSCEEVAALTEMSWGEWEGTTLAQLRERHALAMARNEARGLDFRPDGGESPREVVERLRSWLSGLEPDGTGCAVTHKGVIRAMLSLATGWNMSDKFGERLHWDHGHAFRIDAGRARIHELNVPLYRARP